MEDRLSEEAPLAIEVDASIEKVTVLRIRGEIDIATLPSLHATLSVGGRDRLPIVVDLREVTFIDSSGLRELGQADLDGPVALVMTAGSIVERVIEVAGLKQAFKTFEDVDAACADLAGD